jgi:nicotinamidase-related amidase
MKRTFLLSLAVLVVLSAATSASAETQKLAALKPALVVIDIQNAFIPMMSEADVKAGLPAINEYINLFRGNGLPVIRVYHSDPAYGPKPGTKEFEFPETTTIKPDDPMIVKTYGNAFNKTDLDKILKEKGINTLFLCGLSSTGCVLATYHGALDADYNVFMIKGALIGPDPALTKAVLEICNNVDWSSLLVMVKSALYENKK